MDIYPIKACKWPTGILKCAQYHPHVHCSITHKTKIWKQPKRLLTNEQIKSNMSTHVNFLCFLENLSETLLACLSTGMCI